MGLNVEEDKKGVYEAESAHRLRFASPAPSQSG